MENKNLKEETLNKDYLTKCTSQPKDLESALKKIANLHIALNKKVEKNKNQALEITKLLEQKKDLQDKLNQANRVVKLTIDNSSKLANFLDEKNEIIKEKENKLNQLNSMSNYVDDFHYRLKEKDIIISYLRSELK